VLSSFSRRVAILVYLDAPPKPEDKYSSKHGKISIFCVQGRLKRCVPDLRENLTVSEAKWFLLELTATMRRSFPRLKKGFCLIKIESDYKLPSDKPPRPSSWTSSICQRAGLSAAVKAQR